MSIESKGLLSNESISTVDRMKAMLLTMQPGEFIDYYEAYLIDNGIKYARYMNNSRFGAQGELPDTFDRMAELLKVYREFCKKRTEVESSIPVTELNAQATPEMVSHWNLIHRCIYDAKVYGDKGLSMGLSITTQVVKIYLLSLSIAIWKDGTMDNRDAKENYLALRRKFEELGTYVNRLALLALF